MTDLGSHLRYSFSCKCLDRTLCGNIQRDEELMKKECDFFHGKRGAVLSNAGKTRITIYLDNKTLQHFKAESERTGRAIRRL